MSIASAGAMAAISAASSAAKGSAQSHAASSPGGGSKMDSGGPPLSLNMGNPNGAKQQPVNGGDASMMGPNPNPPASTSGVVAPSGGSGGSSGMCGPSVGGGAAGGAGGSGGMCGG